MDVITGIVNTYSDCYFDITGGDESLILSLGMVYNKYPDKNIKIQKFNLRNNTIYDFSQNNASIINKIPYLTIEENIRIHGGDVIFGYVDEKKTYVWDLNSDFLNDIGSIWDICKDNVRYWNTQIGVFEAIEHVGWVCEDGLTTIAYISEIDEWLANHNGKRPDKKSIINDLLKRNLLVYYEENDTDETIIIS